LCFFKEIFLQNQKTFMGFFQKKEEQRIIRF
jgi:hypothetical protein